MERLVTAGFKAFRSLFLPGMMGVFVLSLVVTVVSLIVFGFAAVYTGTHVFPPLVNSVGGAEYVSWVPWIVTIGVWVMAWFLFPLVMPLISLFYSNTMARIIERDEYNALPAVNPNSFAAEFWHNLAFAVKAIFLNIIILPLYLLPVANIFIFYGLNGYLLGSQFYMVAATRNLTYAQAKEARRKDSGVIFWGGVAITFMATIPIVNLFAPFWGIALMVHLFRDKSLAT